MTARNRVAMAARWLKVAVGHSQRMARRRSLIAAMAEAGRSQEDQPDDAAGEQWDDETDDQGA